MNDYEKVSRLEMALRTERDQLRGNPGPDNQKASNAINTYLQTADTDSKLRFANILLGEPTELGAIAPNIRAVS